MLESAMLAWIGWKLNAPTWYWVCWSTCCGISIIRFAFEMFKAGAKL